MIIKENGKMFEKYIKYIDVSDNDKQRLKSFFELLDSYLETQGENNSIKSQLINLNTEELSYIFKIAKINPKLQIDIWRVLPSEIVDNPENSKIFEAVLDNKFGEYLQEIDKNSLVKVLNGSRERNRGNG